MKYTLLRILLILVYIFTAQLTVHAFGMHGMMLHDSAMHHGHGDDARDCIHAHGDHHDNHDMNVCLKQSHGIVASYASIFVSCSYATFDCLYCNCPIDGTSTDVSYFHFIDDPGGSIQLFSNFLKIHTSSIVMRC